LASVAMLEKLALLKIALWSAPVFSSASECRTSCARSGSDVRAAVANVSPDTPVLLLTL
jgi:hypothetical protein